MSTDEAAEAPAAKAATADGPTAAVPATEAAEAPAAAVPAAEAAEAEAAAEAAHEEAAAAGDDLRQGLLEAFTTELGDHVVGHHIKPGIDLWVRVSNEAWRSAGEVAKAKLGCTYFCFLSAIDWQPAPLGRNEVSPLDPAADQEPDLTPVPGHAGGDTRFQVFARVERPGRDGKGYGVTLKADLDSVEPRVATWIPVYAGANWHEREAWEMYGIQFDGHPHLVHLYLPGAFEGYPLRKDFPLLAREVKPWPGIVDVEPMPEGDDDSASESEAVTEEAPA